MEILHGRNLIIKVNGIAIAGARSCEITVNSEEIEVSSVTQGTWREFIAGRKDWSASTSYLVAALAYKFNSQNEMVGQIVTFRFEEKYTQNVLQGSAIVKSWKVTGTIGNIAQGSFSFRGTGPLV